MSQAPASVCLHRRLTGRGARKRDIVDYMGVFMNSKIRTEAVSHLFQAILTLENEEECFEFFEDLCTVNELLSLSQRFEVASMLKRKDTYMKIAQKTGASTATISRVNRSLNYGNDGYDMVFGRMKSYISADSGDPGK